jgi:hypothetical protein
MGIEPMHEVWDKCQRVRLVRDTSGGQISRVRTDSTCLEPGCPQTSSLLVNLSGNVTILSRSLCKRNSYVSGQDLIGIRRIE